MIIKNLIKKYDNNIVLNINYMELATNRIYGLVGPNGAGKTTLFKCMTNIVTNYEGQVIYEGDDVKEKPSTLKDFSIVLDGLKVYESFTGFFNIEYFTKLRGDYDKNKAIEIAKKLKIDHVLDKKVSTYSYGMKKKLLLLIAIITKPKFLILDEPFRGVDVESVAEMKQILKEMNRNGMGIIISSHVIDDLNELCEEVILLSHGNVVKNIDVNRSTNNKYRFIETSDDIKFVEILEKYNYAYEKVEGRVKVDIGFENWSYVYQELNNEGVHIVEMNKAGTLGDNIAQAYVEQNGGLN